MEDLPPGQVGKGGLLGRTGGATERRRGVYHGPLVVGADPAARQKQGKQEVYKGWERGNSAPSPWFYVSIRVQVLGRGPARSPKEAITDP